MACVPDVKIIKQEDKMEEAYKILSKRLKAGEQFTLYVKKCVACKIYKRILAGAPAGPGGTLSCPLCSYNKENGPHI